MTTKNALPEISMPEAETALLKDRYRKARWILEYGAGGSTVFAARECKARIYSVESDKTWADDLRNGLADEGWLRDGVQIQHVDIGATKEWGMPVNHNNWRRYWHYPVDFWVGKDRFEPDLILIDGRFRMGCLAIALMQVRVPTTILFDDYANRRMYRDSIEPIVKPVEVVGRMARFEVEPKSFDAEDFVNLLPLFFSSR